MKSEPNRVVALICPAVWILVASICSADDGGHCQQQLAQRRDEYVKWVADTFGKLEPTMDPRDGRRWALNHARLKLNRDLDKANRHFASFGPITRDRDIFFVRYLRTLLDFRDSPILSDEAEAHIVGMLKKWPQDAVSSRAFWPPSWTENHDLMHLTIGMFARLYRGEDLSGIVREIKQALSGTTAAAPVKKPAKGETKQAGEFKMGSTAAEKKWAVGQEGGASFSSGGGRREAYEGKPRPMRVEEGFWMGRTEVTVGQFRRFVAATGFVTDAEKPGGNTQCFNTHWVPQNSKIGQPPHPWIAMEDKSWRDPNHGIIQKDHHPVVCVSYNDMNAFCDWLTKTERAAGSLPAGLIYRLPTEAEWAYACRGGRRDSSYYWWGNDLNDAKGRLNISAIDFLPGEDYVWSGAKLPWSDGFAMVSPVDHYGERGRNGFGLADMCGGVWEFVLDHFDPTGGHEQVYFEDARLRSVSRPVCRGGTFYDVPGNARCAVRLGISSVTYSDSRDGFRLCLGVPRD